MRKLILLIFGFVLLFSACKKDGDPNYYVKLKINGAWVTWYTVAGELGPDLGDPAKTDLGVTGNDDAQKDIFDFTIQIDGSNFTTGTYTSDNTNYLLVLDYFKNATSANSRFFQINTAVSMPDSKFTINITSITSTEIQGNFNGNYLYDDTNTEFLGLTEGEFKVRRLR